MSEYIDPISEEKINIFVDPQKYLHSVRYREDKTRQLTRLRLINNPDVSPVDTFTQSTFDVNQGLQHPNDLIQEELNIYGGKQYEAALEAAQNVDVRTPGSVQRSVDIIENAELFKTEFLQEGGMQKMEADSLSPISPEDYAIRQRNSQRYAFQVFNENMEERGITDKVWDGISLLAPDFIKDVNDLVGEGPLDSLTTLNSFIRNFQLLDPDEQMVLMDEVVPQLFDAFDQNEFKVAAMIGLMYDKVDSGKNIAFSASLDVIDFASLSLAGLSIAKGLKASKSVANAAEDVGAIEDAARLQAVSGLDDVTGDVQRATGISRADSAHSTNPHDIGLLDEGASIDGIAGEINKIKELERQAILNDRAIVEDLLPIAGNKLDRGTLKALNKEKRDLEVKLDNLARFDEVDTARLPNNQRKLVIEARKANEADKALLNERLNILNRQLDDNRIAASAEADLSRLSQGIIPERYQGRIQEAADRWLDQLRRDSAARRERQSVQAQNASQRIEPTTEAEQTAQALNNVGVVFPRTADRLTQEVDDLIKSVIRPQAFTPEERAYAITKAKEQLHKDLSEAGQVPDSVRLVEQTDEGFTLKYSSNIGEGEKTLKFTRDDVGSYIAENQSLDFKQRWTNLLGKFFSPEILLQHAFPKLVSETTFAGQQAARIRNTLASLWQQTEKGLTRDELFQIDSVLMSGDEAGEVYSIAQLRAGVETNAGIFHFTDKQINSYYLKRRFFDELHKLRDHATRRQLEIAGYENLSYTAKINGENVAQQLIGRRKKTFDLSELKADDLVLFPGNVNRTSTREWIGHNTERLKAEGYEVVELLETRKINGKDVTLALVKRDDNWSALPKKVLNYQAGYVPRIYPPNYHYVRDMASETQEVLYAFPNKDKAKAWVEQARVEAAAEGKEIRYGIFADREFNAVSQLVEDSNAFGGLYTGSRKRRPLMVKDGDRTYKPERMGVGKATERYVQNIADIFPLNEYRSAAMERWKNTVKQLGKAQGRGAGLTDPKDFSSPITLDKDSANVMEQAREYIKNTMGMKSPEESVTERFMLGTANLLEGKPFAAPIRQFALDHSRGNVSSWIKGHSWNIHMGWYNPRQLFIQASNASLAMVMNPTKAPGAIADALRMRTIALLPEHKLQEAGRHLGLSDDLIQSVREYNRSGLRDAILRTGDWNANISGISRGSMDAVRKAAKGGRIFYEEGENFSRLLTWSIARKKWKETNPGKAVDNNAIQAISQDTVRMQMNMQAENAAWWQNYPGLNIATQFMQVFVKFIEQVAPRAWGGGTQWTRKEKMAALTGQIALYGTVGVPVAEEALSYISSITGTPTQQLIEENPTLIQGINEGFTGIMGHLFGIGDMNISKDMNLLAGMTDNAVADLINGGIEIWNGGYDDTSALEMFTGPSANLIRRTGDVASTAMLSIKDLYETPSLGTAYGAIIENMDAIASMTSTWTNARKALILNQTGMLFSSRGTLVATERELGDMSLPNQLAIAMGFTPDLVVAHYKNKQIMRDLNSEKSLLKKEMKQSMLMFSQTGNLEAYQARKAVLTAGLTPSEKLELMKDVNRDLLLGKSDLDRTLKTFQRRYLESGGRVGATTQQEILMNEVEVE